MTDGIIQEAFFDFLARNYFNSNKGLVVSVEQVTAFKKELIEKIKQYELLCYKDNRQPTTYVPKISLIGDNQE